MQRETHYLRIGHTRSMQMDVLVLGSEATWFDEGLRQRMLNVLRVVLVTKLNALNKDAKTNADVYRDCDMGFQFAYCLKPVQGRHSILEGSASSDPARHSFNTLHLHPLMLLVAVESLKSATTDLEDWLSRKGKPAKIAPPRYRELFKYSKDMTILGPEILQSTES
ncbi:hypothetical protein HDU81_004429 [Chytriomyces hyalinus]|nr:hypothetical protein HDU81_004429 [Chytriomyces hyalinus]